MTPESKALLLQKSINNYAKSVTEKSLAQSKVELENKVRLLMAELRDKVDISLSDNSKKTDSVKTEIVKSIELISKCINSIKELRAKTLELSEQDSKSIKLAQDTQASVEQFTAELQIVRYKIQQLELSPDIAFESDNIDISDKIKNNKRVINLHAKNVGGERVTVINSPGGGGSIANPFDYPSQTGNAGKFLTTNGTTVNWGVVAGASGGLAAFTVTTYTSSTNLPSIRQIARADTTGASITLTLPGASANVGLEVNIKKVADQNTLTINDINGQLIDGVANAPVYVNGVDISLVSFGAGWDII